jgi:hypothetical protein
MSGRSVKKVRAKQTTTEWPPIETTEWPPIETTEWPPIERSVKEVKSKQTTTEWPPRESRSINEVLIDDANLVCRSYDGKHHRLKNRSSQFNMNDFLAPHLLLLFLEYKNMYPLDRLLTISFDDYAVLRKDNHITTLLIDNYLETKKLLLPHSVERFIFTNHGGDELNFCNTRDMLSRYTLNRFGTRWQDFQKAYQSELRHKTISASAYHSSTVSFPADSIIIAANTTPAVIEQVESSTLDVDLENFEVSPLGVSAADGVSGIPPSSPTTTQGISRDTDVVPLLHFSSCLLSLSLCLSVSLSPPS